jgi:hypothetical protein
VGGHGLGHQRPPAGRGRPGDVDVLLDGEGHARERSGFASLREGGIDLVGEGAGSLVEHHRQRVDDGVHLVDPRQMRVDHLSGARGP